MSPSLHIALQNLGTATKIRVTRGGRNKWGRKQMRANANKRRQMLTNASKRRGENASKRKQTWTNASKRLHPPLFRRTQEGCGGLRAENPAAFPKAGPIFQQPFSLPENAQTLAGIAFRAAGKSGNNFPAASKFARKLFQQGISDSRSLLEFSDLLRFFTPPL